ncbi:tripartite tricarboxylate transporter TctB family protein [Halomonas sp. WWR20]
MEDGFLSLFDVSINFEQSHLFFPRIITWLMLGLLALILVSRSKKIMPGLRQAGRAVFYQENGFDRQRFFGTIALIVAYFYLMGVVGNIFPNTGYGFLLVSMPFIFSLSTLYVDERSRRNMTIIAVTALIAPGLSWYVLSELFRITLP